MVHGVVLGILLMVGIDTILSNIHGSLWWQQGVAFNYVMTGRIYRVPRHLERKRHRIRLEVQRQIVNTVQLRRARGRYYIYV